jgi:alkyl hydroperoxide reductase subunit AhpC
MFAQKAFADFFKITNPLLSGGRDVTLTHKVLKAYGVLREDRLTANRSYFIIDKEGVVRYKNIRPSGGEKDLIPTDTLLNEVKKINKGS